MKEILIPTMRLMFPVIMACGTAAIACVWKIVRFSLIDLLHNDIDKSHKRYILEPQCGKGPFLTSEQRWGRVQLLAGIA